MTLASLLFATLLAATHPAPAPDIRGAWQIVRGDGATGTMIVTDDHFSIAWYQTKPAKFVSTEGGSWKPGEEGHVLVTYEYDTANPERVGTTEDHRARVSGDELLTGDGSARWKRLDDGTPGALEGAWLMTGRKRDGEITTRTPGVRRTMKILSGTRFQWIAYNVETRQFFGSGGGTYTTKNGAYTENIEFFSRDDAKSGRSLEFRYGLLDGVWHHEGKSTAGEPMYEVWEKRSKLAALPLSAATLLVANKSDHTVDLIDPATGTSRATLETGRAPHEIAVSPDGKTAVVANYGDRGNPGSSLTVIDVPGAKLLRTIDLGAHTRPHGVVWIDARRLAVTTEGSRNLLVVDVKAGEVASAVATGQEVSHMVALAAGRDFVANIGSGSVTVIDLEGGKKLRDVETGAGAEGIAVRPGTSEVWVTNRAADTLSVIDAKTLEVTAEIEAAGFPIRIAFTPDGGRALVSAARTGEVILFDAAKRRELRRAKLDLTTAPDAAQRLFGDQFGTSPVPVGLLVSPDGKSAYVAATQADAVVVIDAATLEVRNVLRAGREPDGMAWSAK